MLATVRIEVRIPEIPKLGGFCKEVDVDVWPMTNKLLYHILFILYLFYNTFSICYLSCRQDHMFPLSRVEMIQCHWQLPFSCEENLG